MARMLAIQVAGSVPPKAEKVEANVKNKKE
jgi:hypothetical protein